MFQEVDLSHFSAAHADGALVVDVREPHEYESGHVPGARLIPLGILAHHAADLPSDRPIYVVCQSGGRSRSAAAFLHQLGHDVRSVLGGTGAWIAAGRPVVRGVRANAV